MSDSRVELMIEIVEGVAQPAALYLTPGEKLGPIDVGTQGSWRVLADGVVPKHAAIFYDGDRLCLMTMEDAPPVVVHGQAIPASWVVVEPPCEIAIGAARLSFGPADDDVEVEPAADVATTQEELPTVADQTRVVSKEGLMASVARHRASSGMNITGPQRPLGAGAPPPPSRPHRLPELGSSAARRDEPATAPTSVPLPSVITSSRLDRDRPAPVTSFPWDPPAPAPAPEPPPPPPSFPRSVPEDPPVPWSSLPESPTFPLPPPAPPAGPPLVDFDLPPPSAPTPPSMTTQGSGLSIDMHRDFPGAPAPGAAAKKPSRWQAMSFPQKATVILFLPMIASVVIIFTDYGVPKPAPGSAVPASTASATTTTTKARVDAPAASATVTAMADREGAGEETQEVAPEDTGEIAMNVEPPPSGTAAPVESAAKAAPKAAASVAVAEPKEAEPKQKPRAPRRGDKRKTLQRRAVDAVAAASYAEAAQLYEDLAKQEPDNEAYRAAAAITRAKASDAAKQ